MAERDLKGRFKKGNRAGRGRAVGSRNKATVALDTLGQQHAEAVLTTVLAAAVNGDVSAAAIVLQRVWPVRRGRPFAVDLPRIQSAADVVKALGRITAAVAAGDLTVEEGRDLVALVDLNRQAIATHDHEARIAALEEASSDPSQP